MKKREKYSESRYSQGVGQVLAHHLRESPISDCLSPEEIAALVEGTLKGEERERVMTHISSCDTCYETLTITSELEEKEISEIKVTPIFSHPLRLAASILVAGFSLFLFYKFVFVPAAKEELRSDFVMTTEAPAASPGRLNEDKKKEAVKPDERTMVGTEETLNYSVPMKKRAQPVAPEKDSENRPVLESYAREEEKSTGGNLLAKSRDGRTQDKDQQVFQQRQLSTEPEQRQEEQAIQSTRSKKGLSLEGQKRGVPEEMASITRLWSDPNFFRDVSVWQKLDVLKSRFASQKGYIAPSLVMELFASTLALCPELEKEALYFKEQARGRLSPEQGFAFQVRVLPMVQVITTGEYALVNPDVRYMLSRCEPGTLAHEFFTLTMQGWCDPTGICRGVPGTSTWMGQSEKSQTGKNLVIDSDLKQKWLALKPRLQGIFFEIADTTIATLEKSNR